MLHDAANADGPADAAAVLYFDLGGARQGAHSATGLPTDTL